MKKSSDSEVNGKGKKGDMEKRFCYTNIWSFKLESIANICGRGKCLNFLFTLLIKDLHIDFLFYKRNVPYMENLP